MNYILKNTKILILSLLIFPLSLSAQWSIVNSNTTEDLSDIFFIDSVTGFCAGQNGTFLKSIDAGINWTTINTPTVNDIVKIQFINEDIGFFQTYDFNNGFSTNDIYKSIDGGNSWISIMNSFPVPQINNNDLHARTANFYFNNANGVINFLYSDNPQTNGPIRESWKTSDYGNSWQKLDSTIVGHVILLDSLNWFNGSAILQKTIDGGLTWQESANVNFGGWSVNKHDSWYIHDTSGKGVAVLAYHLDIMKFHSFDSIAQNAFANTNWQGSYYINKMEYIDSLGLFLFSPDANSNTYIKRTYNDGEYFLPQIDTLIDIYDIAFHDLNTGWACGKNGYIYRTTSGGGTVSLEELEVSSMSFKVFPNPSNEILTIEILEGMKIVQISLYNLEGQIVKNFNNSERNLNIKDISSGQYLLNIRTAKEVINKKIIIK